MRTAKTVPFFLRGTLTRGAMPTELSQPQARIFRVQAADIDKEKRTVELCFSTDTPVARWGILEVLSHAQGAVDLSRLNAGASVLFNHDMNDYVGVVESARIDGDNKGRATIRFNTSERAEQIFTDVQSGMLRNVSVGYQVHEWEHTIGDDNKVDTWTAKRWEPYEISIVTVPADKNAGIGRQQTTTTTSPKNSDTTMTRAQLIAALQQRGIKFDSNATDEQLAALLARSQTPEPTPTPPAPDGDGTRGGTPTPAPAPAAGITTADNNQRVATILDMVTNYSPSIPRARELGDAALRRGDTPQQFQQTLLDEFNARGAQGMEESATVGLSPREVAQFSFVRFMRALTASPHDRRAINDARFEMEVSDAAIKRMSQHGRSAKGMVIPSEVLHYSGARDIVSIKDGTGYAGTGTNIVPATYLPGSYLDLLRNACVLIRNCTPLPDLQGSLAMPRQLTGATSGWVGEDDEAPETSVTFGQDVFSHKTVSAYIQVTRDMLNQSSPGVEQLIRKDLAIAQGTAIDTAGFYGTGGAQPTGIKNISGIAAVLFDTGEPNYKGIVDMETSIASANADTGSKKYIFNNGILGKLKTTKRFAESGTDTVLLDPGNTVNGYAYDLTEQTKAVDMFFGVWSEFLYGMWGGLEVEAGKIIRRGRLEISVFQDINFMLRRPECFCFGDLTKTTTP